MDEIQLRKRIEVTKRQLKFAENCDWIGQIIYCQYLLEKYEAALMDIILNTKK